MKVAETRDPLLLKMYASNGHHHLTDFGWCDPCLSMIASYRIVSAIGPLERRVVCNLDKSLLMKTIKIRAADLHIHIKPAAGPDEGGRGGGGGEGISRSSLLVLLRPGRTSTSSG